MVKFMSMAIGNNMGISTNYQSNTRKASETKNVREYSNYLKDKYSCLTPGKNVSISVTPGMLKKAMNDEKTGQWLERELGNAAKYISDAQKSASARGSRLTYAAIEFGEEYTTMYVCAVTDTPGTDSEIDKWLERVLEKKDKPKTTSNKVEKDDDEKTEEVTGKEYSFKFKGTDLQSVTNSFVEKMEELNAQMNSMNGFDVRV